MRSDKSVTAPQVLELDVLERSFLRSIAAVWVLEIILVLLPLVIYWPTVFHEFDLRDGYSTLREAHEEPGKVLQFCASHARPIYGRLLEAVFRQVDTIRDVQWVRFCSAMLIGVLSLASFKGLKRLGWSPETSLCFAVWITVVPAAQIIVSWSISLPYTIAALFSLAAFFVAEHAIALNRTKKRALSWWGWSVLLLSTSALIYQPSALYYAMPLAATLLARHRGSVRDCVTWLVRHLGLLFAGLALAYGVISLSYAAGWFHKSERVAFESDLFGKLAWFLSDPLPNALSLFVINDENNIDRLAYELCAGAMGLIIITGGVIEWRCHGRRRGLLWFSGLLTLPLLAFAVNLVAHERYATYRTLLALTGVMLCFLVYSLHLLTEQLSIRTRGLVYATLLSAAAVLAQHRSYTLLAEPQGKEWHLIKTGASAVALGAKNKPSVFVIEPSLTDKSTKSIYHDEFGSLSSNSAWVPKEMFKRAMHDLHPMVSNIDSMYSFASGVRLPENKRFDVIVDMRKLRHLRTEH